MCKPPLWSMILLPMFDIIHAFGFISVYCMDFTMPLQLVSSVGYGTGRPIQDVVHTDALINPGNSEGPLLDSSRNLTGINTAIYSPGASSGVGFSIPVDSFGTVTRPILGVNLHLISQWGSWK